MIRVYCLKDPRTGLPFYVGATKSPLDKRLNCHISNVRLSDIKKRRHLHNNVLIQMREALIKEILAAGLRPMIEELCEASLSEANAKEQYYYDFLTEQGYILLQQSNRFVYEQQSKRKENIGR